MTELTVEERIAAKVAGTPLPEAPTDTVDTADTTAEPDDPVEQTVPDAEEAEPETALLAGKYKNVDELERAHNELQSLMGRQGNELSELRQLREQLAEVQQAVTQPQQQYDPGSVDEFLADNPQQIPAMAQRAIEQQDGYLYQRTLAAWQEHDPVGAMDFHAQRVSDAKIAQLRQEMQPIVTGVQQQQATGAFENAYKTIAEKHQDFDAILNSVTQDTLDGFPPEVLGALQTGDQASKERVLETLYRWTKAEQAGNLTAAATQAAAQQAADARADKQAATVATTSGAQDHLAPPVSGVDMWKQQFRESATFKKYS